MKTSQECLEAQKKDKATFFSPANEWRLPAPSVIKPQERDFVVDSGASRHMVSRKDLNSAELDTVRVSETPTTVVTANKKYKKRRSDHVCQIIGTWDRVADDMIMLNFSETGHTVCRGSSALERGNLKSKGK